MKPEYPHLQDLGRWIEERELIRLKRREGQEKPWSDDKVFQTTYFCNVKRNDDPGTQVVLDMLRPHPTHPLCYLNAIMYRCINRREVVPEIPFIETWDRVNVLADLQEIRVEFDTFWGSAYIFSTAGQKMDKLEYLVNVVLTDAYRHMERFSGTMPNLCWAWGDGLQRIHGISSFMAGQVVADLKNTPGHPLWASDDHAFFVVPGPGSLRGLSWVMYGSATRPTHIRSEKAWFNEAFPIVRDWVWRNTSVQNLDAQDIQNCLCEFDKYMRVSTGAGASKRSYNGNK